MSVILRTWRAGRRFIKRTVRSAMAQVVEEMDELFSEDFLALHRFSLGKR
jgi:hypothetical protein